MAASADFKVILTIDSQGNAKIEEVKRGLEGIGETAAKSGQAGAAGADEFAGALMRKLGVMALVTAGLYKLEQAAVGAFKAGIQAVDDFKLTTIGVAATLTDLAKDQSNLPGTFAQNLAYSKGMYEELELAAARYFASGKEMTQAWNILAQKGIVLRKDEIDSLGVIVDRIRLSTQGQVSGIQIAQEMRALLTGQARVTDQIGMLLKDRIPNLEQEIAKHREIGDLVQWLGSQFKGLGIASEAIQGTLESQKSTLETLLTQVGRGGLAGAYSDIVGLLQDANKYITDHKTEISVGIYQGWTAVKEIGGGVVLVIREMCRWLSVGLGTLQGWKESLNAIAKQRADLGVGMAADVLPNLGTDALPAGPKYSTTAQSKYLQGLASAKGGIGYVMTPQGENILVSAEETTAAGTQKLGGGKTKGGGGGGGKGRDTAESLESLILQLRQEEAKLTEGAFGGIDAWYTKITEKIKKLAMDDKQLKDGMLAASELKSAKEEKVSADLNKWYLGQMHQTTAAQIAEDEKKLASVKGHAAEEGKVREVMAQHAQERSDKLALAENQQQKTYYDSLASASVLIKDQVAWKEMSWQIEKKISQAQLEQWFIGKDLTAAQKDDYRGLLALTNQAKEYNLARQKAVDLGTLEGWAIERAGDALKRSRTSIKDALTGVEGFFQDAFSQGITGALSGQKKSFKEVGQTIVQSMILELNKKSFTRIWDEIAKKLAPGTKSTSGGGLTGAGLTGAGGAASQKITKLEQQAAAGSVKAAKELQEAAAEHKDAAGGLGLSAKEHETAAGGLSLSGVSLGLSAGGLLLSGIGIATNSQFLVYAGTALQLVAMAIEVAQMLAAGSLTGSAGALDAAAIALMAAAAVDAATFWHTGGLVAHSGLLVAHDGLAVDERRAIVQTGEGIIKRDTMAEYARQGISFDMLNTGRLPVLPVPAPFAAGNSRGATPDRFQAEVPVNLTMVSPEGKILSRRQERQVITLVRKYKGYGEL